MKKVVNDESNSRFVIEVDGNEAGFAEYKNVGDDVREFHHTVVNPDYRGQGLSKPLIMEALESTREAGYSVIPTCSAVEGFIEKNPDFQDMVHQG
ncbi:acetyltransferase [Corynebacterium falsenii DSM 44353]|uniref:N-acetyltransferase n=1 Tax=Corynebacterium falsenii TaxID=108486 RepID=A0A418Q605_9CORY|nr:GNAT family N-acetyltransferase [Corynebacterium falsenii]AHI02589.1 acetyltransferase [Corynebacterium falsenii DSM 44353]MDC7104096.1 GNAT family N-acetyltransferase [Corynebacterium falsenii]RIX34235.1 N-acetyltransferase [Corynebacterium falsenii]UBI05372.1 N-acetyltransferase [Corynebacterium falsenii]UBI06650.1 N-acetyltransferase [Corynebacterium falsenii]